MEATLCFFIIWCDSYPLGWKWKSRIWAARNHLQSSLLSDYWNPGRTLNGSPTLLCFGSSVPPHTYMVILWICIEGISCQIPSGVELPNTLRLCQKENLWPGFLCRGTASHNKCQIYRLCHSECLWHELLDFSDNNIVKVAFLLSHTVNLSCSWLSGSGKMWALACIWVH